MTFTADEIELLIEALDSHIYWQLSDPHYRSSGFVYPPGSDNDETRQAIHAAEALKKRLEVETGEAEPTR
jgi:hypothetical protein